MPHSHVLPHSHALSRTVTSCLTVTPYLAVTSRLTVTSERLCFSRDGCFTSPDHDAKETWKTLASAPVFTSICPFFAHDIQESAFSLASWKNCSARVARQLERISNHHILQVLPRRQRNLENFGFSTRLHINLSIFRSRHTRISLFFGIMEELLGESSETTGAHLKPPHFTGPATTPKKPGKLWLQHPSSHQFVHFSLTTYKNQPFLWHHGSASPPPSP